jgi:L-seryl-tRNA(Ser) seleniumtransferase
MDMYDKLKVKKIINAWGTVTKVGGSLMDPRVLDAMREAAGSFVHINDLHEKAGKAIAGTLGGEAACITSGASAGIAISAAACMTGTDLGRILQLPDTKGMKNEAIVIKCHRTLYDQALLLSGIKVVEVGATSFCCIEMVENAITENTAMLFYASEAESMRGSLPVSALVPLLKKHKIPLVVDAAAEIPPTSNILKYLQEGADLVIFSGGKELRGPQSSGFILGRKDLIQACDLNCCPNYSIGRPMKIDKETIVGLVRAVELFAEKDYGLEMKRWESMTDTICKALSDSEGISVEKGFPIEPGIQPVIIPRAYIQLHGQTAIQTQKRLLSGEPSVQVGVERGLIAVNPQCLKPEEIQPLIQAIQKVSRP